MFSSFIRIYAFVTSVAQLKRLTIDYRVSVVIACALTVHGMFHRSQRENVQLVNRRDASNTTQLERATTTTKTRHNNQADGGRTPLHCYGKKWTINLWLHDVGSRCRFHSHWHIVPLFAFRVLQIFFLFAVFLHSPLWPIHEILRSNSSSWWRSLAAHDDNDNQRNRSITQATALSF